MVLLVTFFFHLKASLHVSKTEMKMLTYLFLVKK